MYFLYWKMFRCLFILMKCSVWSFSGQVVFQVPDWLHHLLMGTRILFKNTLEMYTDYYLHCKLEQLFQEHRLVSLITLLRGLYFLMCLFHVWVLNFYLILIRSQRVRSLALLLLVLLLWGNTLYIIGENSSKCFFFKKFINFL